MCTSTESTFAWVGAIVINAAFVSFIAWGASTNWQLGLAISCVYTLALYELAIHLDKPSAEQSEEVYENSEEVVSRDIPQGRRSILVSLLYGLSVVALGVTGLFLPTNLFYCPGERTPWPPKPAGRWETDVATLPAAVRSWATSDVPSDHKATFVYLPGTKSTLFSGTNGETQRDVLWVATASVFPYRGAEPVEFLNISMPSEFVSVSDAKACFSCSQVEKMQEEGTPVPTQGKFAIACSGGKFFQFSKDNHTGVTHQSPYDLLALNGTLWYKDYPPSGLGTLIFSLDPSTMADNLHSFFHSEGGESNDGNSDRDDISPEEERECRTDVQRKRSILALFVSALPVVIASILLWVKKSISTMGVTTYIGFSAVAISIYIIIDPIQEHLYDFLKWWHSIFGAFWLAILVDLFFSKRRGIELAPLVWGINFGSLAFALGMVALTVVEEDALWRWVLLNMLVFLPLGVLGVATNHIFLLLLCALGFLADSFRLASWFTKSISPNSEVPVYFLVLAFAGLCISGFGWFLSRHQAVVHARLAGWCEQHSLSRVRNAVYDALPLDGSVPARNPESNNFSQGPQVERNENDLGA